jgi:LacI family gluconate utilization system Gnt-I transcriptional repressor
MPPLARTPRQARRGLGRATLADVAASAGVTAITVSRYLREPARVAPDTALAVKQALTETGYFPNRQAGALASAGASGMVAALIPNLANSIFAETVQGLADGLQGSGCELLLASTNYSLEREASQLRALIGWSPSAIVVTGRHHNDAALALLAQARARGTPVVAIWDQHDNPHGFTPIGFDHAAVGAAMAAHLIERGYRRLVFVDSGVAEDFRAHERGEAFLGEAKRRGVGATRIVAPPGAEPIESGRLVLPALLQPGGPAVDAAAFANDHLACGALLAAQARSIAVPRRLALMGFGDFALGRALEPALSTVQVPRREIGLAAARALRAALAGEGDGAPASLPWAIVERGTT